MGVNLSFSLAPIVVFDAALAQHLVLNLLQQRQIFSLPSFDLEEGFIIPRRVARGS